MLGELGWWQYTKIHEGKQKWLPDAVMLGELGWRQYTEIHEGKQNGYRMQ